MPNYRRRHFFIGLLGSDSIKAISVDSYNSIQTHAVYLFSYSAITELAVKGNDPTKGFKIGGFLAAAVLLLKLDAEKEPLSGFTNTVKMREYFQLLATVKCHLAEKHVMTRDCEMLLNRAMHKVQYIVI